MEILPRDEFLRYSIRSADGQVGAAVLALVQDSGDIDTYFRIHLFGDVKICSNIQANSFLSFPEASNVRMRYECRPGDIMPDINRTATK